MHRFRIGGLAILIVCLTAPGSAASGETTVTQLDVAVFGDVVRVTGLATFGGQPLVTVATDPAGDYPVTDAPPNRLDLVAASIGQPDADSIRFALEVSDLTGGVVPGGDYMWFFGIYASTGYGWGYSITGGLDPGRGGYRFILDEGCYEGMMYVTTGDCAWVANLTATVSGNAIVLDIPRSVFEDEELGLPFPLEGATIRLSSHNLCGAISAGVSRWAVCDGTQPALNADRMTRGSGAGVYEIATEQVEVTLSAPGGEALRTVVAAVGADGSFSASIPTEGLDPGSYQVSAEACFGTNCGLRTATVAIG